MSHTGLSSALSNTVVMGLLMTLAENSTADLLAIYRLDCEATKG